MPKLKDKIALITGASRGIGAEVAKAYAKEGAHVILVARTISGLEETDDAIKQAGGQSTLVPLDLLQYNKIDELGGVVAQRFGRLDILVGNAAMLGVLSPVGHITPDIWEKTISLNLTANFRLLRSFDPLLQRSEAGRAIFVTSNVAEEVSPFWSAYTASKAGLEKLVQVYAAENVKNNIRANLVEPGAVGTRMLAEFLPGRDLSEFKKPEEVTDIFVKLAGADFKETGKVFEVKND